MEDYSRQRHEQAGYEFVYSPHITKANLFETSGHLDWYADGMYPPMELDGGTDYYLKPMNCPFHILIYKSRAALLPRPAAAALRVRHGVPLREVRRRARASPGPAASPRTTPTSSAPRSRCAERARPARSTSCSTCCATTASTTSTSSSRPSPRRRRSAATRSGTRPPRRCAPSPTTRASSSCSTRAAARSTARRSRCRPRTPSAAPGRCRRSSSTSSCPQRFDLEYVGADGERHRRS